MTRLITEGFEAGHLESGYFSGFDISSGFAASGMYSAGLYPGARIILPNPKPTHIFVKFAAYGPYVWGMRFALRNGLNEIIKAVRNGNFFDYYINGVKQSQGRSYFAANWTVFEFMLFLGSSGAIQVRVGGILDFMWTGDLSMYPTIDDVYLDHSPYGYNWLSIDDVVINDNMGPQDDSWPGDRRILPLIPINNGSSSGLVGSDGDQNNNY